LVLAAFSDVHPLQFQKADDKQAADRKIIAESLSQHDEKHVVPTPLSGIRVGEIRSGDYINRGKIKTPRQNNINLTMPSFNYFMN
jgi:hypothetical protein